MEWKADVGIVGAGVLGLAHAYAAARLGQRVIVFERNPRAMGASVRNFGMIWPIGQPHGEIHGVAMRSREIWAEVLQQAQLPYFPTGSLHVVYRDDEAAVACEFSEPQIPPVWTGVELLDLPEYFGAACLDVMVEGNGYHLRRLIAKRRDIFAAYLQMKPEKREAQ